MCQRGKSKMDNNEIEHNINTQFTDLMVSLLEPKMDEMATCGCQKCLENSLKIKNIVDKYFLSCKVD